MKTVEKTLPRETGKPIGLKPATRRGTAVSAPEHATHMEIRFSTLIVGQTRNDVWYLGYPLRLSKTEYALLVRICQAEDWLSREDLAGCCPGGNPDAVPVHIAALNRKACAIGGRQLVETGRSKGYRLSSEP